MQEIKKIQNNLCQHPVYKNLNDLQNLRIFMESHVFAVWDFMSLLKTLQREVTCVEIPWKPSKYPAEMVRLVNEIVLGEESDIDEQGNATSHFDLYLKAMEEVGADTSRIKRFIAFDDFSILKNYEREFVISNLNICDQNNILHVASAFFFGREKLIPGMFESIVVLLEESGLECPTLIYYLKRHILVDSEDHGPKAMKFLDYLIGADEKKKNNVIHFAKLALANRKLLWDGVLGDINPEKYNFVQAHTLVHHLDAHI
jgi:hypothetical protein